MNPLSERILIDFRASEPLYLQIASQVQQLVAHGILKQGDQLPTVRELATELRINFSTVARAYRLLDEEKLISTQRGRGTYIWEEPTEKTMQSIRKKTLEELARKYIQDSLELGCSHTEALEALKGLLNTEAAAPDETSTEIEKL